MTQFEMTRSTVPDSTGRSSMMPLTHLDVRETRRGGVLSRALDHGRSHVDADHAPPGTRDLRGKQKVDAGAGAEIEHRVPLADRGESDRIPAAERVDDRIRGERRHLLAAVSRELRRDSRRDRTAAAAAPAFLAKTTSPPRAHRFSKHPAVSCPLFSSRYLPHSCPPP